MQGKLSTPMYERTETSPKPCAIHSHSPHFMDKKRRPREIKAACPVTARKGKRGLTPALPALSLRLRRSAGLSLAMPSRMVQAEGLREPHSAQRLLGSA